MHCVYKFTFTSRLLNNTPPYYYIGSKSNYSIIDGKLAGPDGSVYHGSSRWDGWNTITTESYEIEILGEFDDYTDCVKYEYFVQRTNDVVASPEYFNLGMAAESNFADPAFATYKHSITGKRVRLERTHPMVLSAEYVGVTAGVKYSDERKQKISESLAGERNPFYGKKHSDETKSKIAKVNSERIRGDEERAKTSARFKGVPKSPEHKAKIGRKGMVSVINVHTNECIRGYPDDVPKGAEWVAPGTITAMRAIEMTCPHCGAKSKSAGNMNRWHNDNCRSRK